MDKITETIITIGKEEIEDELCENFYKNVILNVCAENDLGGYGFFDFILTDITTDESYLNIFGKGFEYHIPYNNVEITLVQNDDSKSYIIKTNDETPSSFVICFGR